MSVRLYLLGQFRLVIDQLDVEVTARKTKALLAWLVMHQGQPQAREKLSAMLWEESGSQQARQSLRQTIADLRRILGDAAESLTTSSDRISIRSGSVDCDALTFFELADSTEEAELERAVSTINGQLLEGLDPRSDTFDNWLLSEQQRVAELAVRALTRLVDHYRHIDSVKAVALGLRLLQVDPLQEQMQRRLMELYRDMGRAEDAVRQYRGFEKQLMTELGISPEPETVALFEETLQSRHVASAPARPSSAVHNGASLRQVTAMALHIKNLLELQLDNEALSDMNQQMTEAVGQQIRPGNGRIVQQTETSYVVVFGLPVASGNEVVRAISAALALRQGMTGQDGFQFSIAITSGQVIADPETPEDVKGPVLSQVEALAQRLTAGEIGVPRELIEPISHTLLHGEVAKGIEPLNLVNVEGFSDAPVQVPFSGRKLQMRQLMLSFDSCRETGQGQTILIRGEAGLGKTRLVEEYVRLVREADGAAGLANLSEFVDENVSNLTRLVTNILGFDLNVTPEQISDDDLIRLGLNQGQRSALIDLLDLEMPRSLQDYWSSLTDEQRQLTRRRGLETIVANATRERPVLTVIEDLQWAEASILARIGVLADIVADYPMILMLTTRLDETVDDLSWRGPSHSAPFMTIDLNPFRQEEAQEFGRHVASDEQVLQRCIERSGGNPLFLEHLLRGASVTTRYIPNSVQSLIEANLYGLPHRDLQAIQAASVYGQEFTQEAVTALLEDDSYLPNLLLRRRLIVRNEDSYRFSHALIRESTYATLLKSRRIALHLRAAAYHEHRNQALRVEHLLLAESEDAPAALLTMAQREQRHHRHDRARILVRKGLSAVADETTRRAFRQLEDELELSDTGWESLTKIE